VTALATPQVGDQVTYHGPEGVLPATVVAASANASRRLDLTVSTSDGPVSIGAVPPLSPDGSGTGWTPLQAKA
jgi:hypothetical protein